jgi:hydroxymethylglutaryl-CoA synthase
MKGLLSYAAYLPRHRLGHRVVASFDEDATTMAVAAARSALRAKTVDHVWMATTSPPYLDKTNAAIVHAALGLPSSAFAADVNGAARSGFAALKAASASGGLAVLADVRVGLPDSADERAGGDGAAAFVFGDGDPIATVLGTASATVEILDRWRPPTAVSARTWEERFGAEQLTPLVHETAERVLAKAGLGAADHVVVVSSAAGVRRTATRLVPGKLSTTTTPIGHAGAADAGLALAAVLDTAAPAETVLLISASDGVDALLLRTTAALLGARQPAPVADQVPGISVEHTRYLTWRGLLDREPPRRPEPAAPAGPPSARAAAWKFALAGSSCTKCGFLHLPPARVCKQCDTVDQMDQVVVSDHEGRIATYTVDRLAYSLSPPVVQAVVDLDGGGRYTFEVADAQPDELEVGRRVTLTFRRLYTADGIHNYFWKALLA